MATFQKRKSDDGTTSYRVMIRLKGHPNASATFARLYVDRDGNDHKPFVLPQQDPRFYDTCLQTYNVPELLCGPVAIGEDELARAILSAAADRP